MEYHISGKVCCSKSWTLAQSFVGRWLNICDLAAATSHVSEPLFTHACVYGKMFWSHCTISGSRNWLSWQGQAIFLVFIANIHPGRERVILILAKRPSYIWGHLEVQCTFDTDHNQIVQIDVFILPSFAIIISPIVRLTRSWKSS